MADPTKQYLNPYGTKTTNVPETLDADRAGSRLDGHTGKHASTAQDLVTQLVNDGPLVPAGSIVKSDGVTKIMDFESTGDADCRPISVARSMTSRKAAIGSKSVNIPNVDLDMEPQGVGRLAEWGDPAMLTSDVTCAITANRFSPTFSVHGFDSPTYEYDTAILALDDANGWYNELPTQAVTNSWAGISSPIPWTKRQLNPELIWDGRTPLLQSRFCFGLLSADPRLAGVDTSTILTTGLSTAVLVTSSSAVTVSAANKTYTRAAGSWIADGHYVGGTPTMASFAQAGNSGVKTIVGLTPLVMTVSNTCTDEAPGAAVTVTTAGIVGVLVFYDHNIANPASTIASGQVVVNAAAKTYTRSDGGDYVADGHRVGNTPTWAGLTASSGANNGVKHITALTATVMTVSETCVNETSSAGTSVSGAPSAFLRIVECSGAPYSLSVPNVNVTGGGLLHRAAGSWIDDGVKEGQLVALSGMNTPGNNVTIRVTNVTALNVTPESLLITDATLVTAGVTGGGQFETISNIIVGTDVVANSHARLRIKYMGSYVWEVGVYDFSSRSWEKLTNLTQRCVSAIAGLRVFWALRTNTATLRKPAIRRLTLR